MGSWKLGSGGGPWVGCGGGPWVGCGVRGWCWFVVGLECVLFLCEAIILTYCD